MMAQDEQWIGEGDVRRRVSGIPRLAACASILMGATSVVFTSIAAYSAAMEASFPGLSMGLAALVGGIGLRLRSPAFRFLALVACLLQSLRGAAWLTASWVVYGMLKRAGSFWVVTQFPPFHSQRLFEVLLVSLSLLAVILLLHRTTRDACLLRRQWKRLMQGLCPLCSYDLQGNVSGICPECGTRVEHDWYEEKFALPIWKTSKGAGPARPGMALLGILAILAGVYTGITRAEQMQTPSGADVMVDISKQSATLPPAVPTVGGSGRGGRHPDDVVYSEERVEILARSSVHGRQWIVLYWLRISSEDEETGRVHHVELYLELETEIYWSQVQGEKVYDEDTGREMIAPCVLKPGEYRMRIEVPDELKRG